MACGLSANGCSIASLSSTSKFFCNKYHKQSARNRLSFLSIRASSDDADCNDEECAPEKEVGKVSVDWLASEKSRVVGTFPPRTRGWTGYVEKDTAGQTNIYSVEPVVYVAESAISSGSAGSSADGSENTAAVAGGIGLISVAAASFILFQVSKASPPQIQTVDYSGPSLSYYINKFKPAEIVEASVPVEAEKPVSSSESESSSPEVSQVLAESSPEVSQVVAESESLSDSTASSSNVS